MKRRAAPERPPLVRDSDVARLRELLASRVARHFPVARRRLAKRLDAARVVSARTLPASVVAMGSRVTLWDAASHRIDDVMLVFPWQASPREGSVSVLSRLGTELLGAVPGQKIEAGDERVEILYVHGAVHVPRPSSDVLGRRAG